MGPRTPKVSEQTERSSFPSFGISQRRLPPLVLQQPSVALNRVDGANDLQIRLRHVELPGNYFLAKAIPGYRVWNLPRRLRAVLCCRNEADRQALPYSFR